MKLTLVGTPFTNHHSWILCLDGRLCNPCERERWRRQCDQQYPPGTAWTFLSLPSSSRLNCLPKWKSWTRVRATGSQSLSRRSKSSGPSSQLVGRAVQKLPVTTSELFTCAIVTCMYSSNLFRVVEQTIGCSATYRPQL
jgi:hypothetical protein